MRRPDLRAEGLTVVPSGKDLPFLATVDETAAFLRTTRKAVYVMIERGLLPGVTRLGRRVLVRSDRLLEWVNQNCASSPKE